jgi:hypothetical protein
MVLSPCLSVAFFAHVIGYRPALLLSMICALTVPGAVQLVLLLLLLLLHL